MKDPVISVKDLFAECIRKAQVIIICTVIFAVALCGFKFFMDMKSLNDINNSTDNSDAVVEVELTEDEQLEVQNYVNIVNKCASLKDYLNESIYINCNPYDVNYVQIQYYIKSSSEEQQGEAGLALRNYILCGGLASDLSERDGKIETKYLLELIKCESISQSSFLNNGTMEIIMYAESEEQAQTYAAWIKEYLDNFVITLNKVGIECELQKITEQTAKVILSNLIYERNDKQNQYKDFVNQVSELETTLTAEQMNVAMELLEENDLVEKETNDIEEKSASINIKYFILGGVLGCLFGVVLIAIKYIFTNTIKVGTDVQNMFGIAYLGQLTCKKNNIWDKIANKIFYPKENFNLETEKQIIISKLKVYCNKNKITNLVISASVNENEKKHLEDIVLLLKENNIVCKILEKNIFEEFEKVENVIMVENIGKTSYATIENDLLFYKIQQIHVLGYIVII